MGSSSSSTPDPEFHSDHGERPSTSSLHADWEPSKAPAYRAKIKEQMREKVWTKLRDERQATQERQDATRARVEAANQDGLEESSPQRPSPGRSGASKGSSSKTKIHL
eukprot:s497_g42.t1